jgi:DNA gyrase inhibitor GyrI
MLIGILGAAVVGVGAWVAAGLWIKRGVEEPAFDVLSRDGEVEVRRYAPTVVAVTIVEGEREVALNEGFRRLAGYIFGKNRSKQKVAMTAPVSATRSEKIAMTAPVSASPAGAGTYRVTFTMPPGSTLESLPEPEDPRVLLEAVPSRDLAAVRFSGWARTASIEDHTEELLAWARREGREIDGAPTLAQYDPPFTMPLLRRNEILVALR